jgi:hypothetical protein
MLYLNLWTVNFGTGESWLEVEQWAQSGLGPMPLTNVSLPSSWVQYRTFRTVQQRGHNGTAEISDKSPQLRNRRSAPSAPDGPVDPAIAHNPADLLPNLFFENIAPGNEGKLARFFDEREPTLR